MCKTQTETQTQAMAAQESPQPLDAEIRKANLQVQLANLRAQAEYNASPAGQMQRQFETYQRLAQPLAQSSFVPDAYRGNLGDCIIAVEMAARLGVFPLTVMQNLCIVKGKPTWASKFLIGCVNTCGRYSTLDYRLTIDGKVGPVKYKTWEKGRDNKNHEVLKEFSRPDLDNLTCVAFATELKTGKVLTSPPVSIRMAVMEGWYMKDGSKWPSMPELMLRYRAASYWVSTFAPEMSMGFRTEEEQRDIVDVEYTDISDTVTEPPTRTQSSSRRSDGFAKAESLKQQMRRKQTEAAAEPEPSAPAEETAHPEPQPEPHPSTPETEPK